VHDPFADPAAAKDIKSELVDLDRLLAESDLVTLHCPSTPQTRRLLDKARLGRMKPRSILVNLGRGDLVDTGALVEALQSGHLAGAALDVCDPEPVPAGHPLLSMDNVVMAPHIASASLKATRKLRESAAGIVACAVRGEPLLTIVNGVKA
jgi:D-3-phosphoglycerate dehydrogenase